MKKFLKKIVDPRIQIGIAIGLIVVSLIGWPVSALTFARDEPPLILALSWLALIISGYAGLISALGNKAFEDKDN